MASASSVQVNIVIELLIEYSCDLFPEGINVYMSVSVTLCLTGYHDNRQLAYVVFFCALKTQ